MPEASAILSSIRDALTWAPDWLTGLAVLVIAIIAALIVHQLIYAVFGRALGERRPFLRAILWRIKGPFALALIAFALAAALQTAPFSETVSATFGRLLLIA